MSDTSAVPLPGPSSSERPLPRTRALTALGVYLVKARLVSEAVVLEWERQYCDDLASRDEPLF